MKKRKFVIAAAGSGLLLAALIFMVAFSNKKEDKSLYSAYQVIPSEDLHFSGTIKAKKVQDVFYDSVLGEISGIVVKNGTDVKAGDVLINYSSKDDQLALNEKLSLQAKYGTNIENLNNELQEERYKYNQAVSNGDETKKQSAESRISSIEASITQYQDLLAEIDAQINSLHTKKESSVLAEFDGKAVIDEAAKKDTAKPVVTVYSAERTAQFSVTEYDVEKVVIDQQVKVKYMNQEKTVGGKISYRAEVPNKDEGISAVYLSEVLLDESIPLGYSVKVSVPQNEIKIPSDAVLVEKGKNIVFVYKKGKVTKREINVEKQDEQTYILKKGLEVKEQIIRKPKGLKDQMEVKLND